MNPRLSLGAHWWPQWRSHWRVLHAWPVSAQCLLLSACALLMSLWLSWQVSGQAWLTWWQSQQRQEAALLQLKTLHGKLDQHQQRVAALQAMRHPRVKIGQHGSASRKALQTFISRDRAIGAAVCPACCWLGKPSRNMHRKRG